MGAHRYAWIVAHGPIAAGMQVLHKCDNPPCDRVDHLFLGTPQDNVDDRRAKGRGLSIESDAVKRRTIWLADDEWARLVARAVREGVNPSNLVRTLAGADPVAIAAGSGVPRPALRRR